MVYLYTGEGGGKTTAALGAALRAIGHKKKVVVIQFMKGWKNTGEYKIRKTLAPYYEIYQFGRKGWVNYKNPEPKDIELANKALEFAKKIVKTKKPYVLVLDEINLACAIGLIKTADVVRFIENLPKSVTVFLTGRNASKELREIADFVSEVKLVKHPFYKGFKAQKGIQY